MKITNFCFCDIYFCGREIKKELEKKKKTGERGDFKFQNPKFDINPRQKHTHGQFLTLKHFLKINKNKKKKKKKKGKRNSATSSVSFSNRLLYPAISYLISTF